MGLILNLGPALGLSGPELQPTGSSMDREINLTTSNKHNVLKHVWNNLQEIKQAEQDSRLRILYKCTTHSEDSN